MGVGSRFPLQPLEVIAFHPFEEILLTGVPGPRGPHKVKTLLCPRTLSSGGIEGSRKGTDPDTPSLILSVVPAASDPEPTSGMPLIPEGLATHPVRLSRET